MSTIDSLYDQFNLIFEEEYVGYRFCDGIIIPISDKYEVASINAALDQPYLEVYNHLSKSNMLLADRDHPDYENSIKESISAVEALCSILTGIQGKEATLGRLLKYLDSKDINIHPCLCAAFEKLYGYTNDANGIRHAGNIGGASATFAEAKFMLVSCSAFINYAITVYSMSKDEL